jgi:hypothetical protein
MRESTGAAAFPDTVQELLNTALLSTRIVVGLMLIVVWPGVLWLAALLMRPGGVPWKAVLATGLLLASSTYLVSWGPPDQLGYVFPILVAVAVIPIVATFKAGLGPSLLIWAIQGVLAPCAILISVIALEGSVFVQEFPRIAQYAKQHDTARRNGADSGQYLLSPVLVPVSSGVRWESTGSTWIDARANKMSCQISSAAPDLSLTVEFRSEKGTLFYDHVTALPYTFAYGEVLPNQPYRLLITGQENAKIDIAVRSLIRPRFGD